VTERDKQLNRAIVIKVIEADQPNYYKQLTLYNPVTNEISYLNSSGILFFNRSLDSPDYPPYIYNDGYILGSVLIKRMLDGDGKKGHIVEQGRYNVLKLKNPDTGETFIIEPDHNVAVMSIFPRSLKKIPYKYVRVKKSEKIYNNDDEFKIEKDYLDDEYRKKKSSNSKSKRKIKVVRKCKCK
jgi:hypothetical protein